MAPPISAPPALHFLVTAFAYACGVHLCTFTCTTDTPVRLTAHVSAERPAIRRIPYVKRGADFVLSSLTCFVETQTILQTEPGDTLTHTFIIPFPDYDHTYYWYLTGTQGGTPCQSISQIFWHNCPTPTILPTIAILYSATGPSGATADGYVWRGSAAETFPVIRAGAGVAADCSGTQLTIGWRCSWRANLFTYNSRIKVSFDLASIPLGSTILSVKFSAVTQELGYYGAMTNAFGLFLTTAPSYTCNPPSDYQKATTTPISDPIYRAACLLGVRYEITIYPAFHYLFVPGQKAMFAIREATYDATLANPPWVSYGAALLRFWSVDAGPGQQPWLEVTYLPPP